MNEQLYIVVYDIAGLWRMVTAFDFSVPFEPQGPRRAYCSAGWNHPYHKEDYVITIDLVPADGVKPCVISVGKEFQAVVREAIIV